MVVWTLYVTPPTSEPQSRIDQRMVMWTLYFTTPPSGPESRNRPKNGCVDTIRYATTIRATIQNRPKNGNVDTIFYHTTIRARIPKQTKEWLCGHYTLRHQHPSHNPE